MVIFTSLKNDEEIIELYWNRDESAISETDSKYGRLCRYVANHILSSLQDCEECINDTYFAVWNAIPPKRPNKFSSYVSRVTRNLALTKFDYLTAAKRNAEAVRSLEELGECVSGRDSIDSELAGQQIELAISEFLWEQEEEKRNIFIRRYWYFDSIEEICRQTGFSKNKVKSMLFRMRGKLKAHLESEGIEV